MNVVFEAGAVGFALKDRHAISARTKAALAAAKARGVNVPIPVSPSSCAQRTSPASSPSSSPLGGGDLFDLLGRVGAGIVRVRHKIGRAAEHDGVGHLHGGDFRFRLGAGE